MAEAIVSFVLDRLAPLIEKKVRDEVGVLFYANEEVENLSSKLMKIHQVLGDADRKAVTDPRVKGWLDKLQEIAYEIEDALDEWEVENIKQQLDDAATGSTEVPQKDKVSSFLRSVCLCFKQTVQTVQRRSIALDVKHINERLDSIAQENEKEFNFIPSVTRVVRNFKPVESTSFVEVSEVLGRDLDKNRLLSKLLSESSSSQGDQDKIRIISIVGAGGMGKTTLAQLVFDEFKKQNVRFKPIWVCVSDPFDGIKIAQTILNELESNYQGISQFETLLKRIERSISGEKFFLVLDDVWTEDDTMWKPLKKSLMSGSPGSRVLVTTRNERVAEVIGSTYSHQLGRLSDPDCWSVLSQIAFHGGGEGDREMLKETGWKIAKKCNGMPLAAKAIGGLLRFKADRQGWQQVLESEMWGLEMKKGVFPFLNLSYDELNPSVKRCFSYCAIFPKDYEIDVDDLIKVWMAQGFLSSGANMEQQGREYFEDLAMRSFFQEFKQQKGRIFSCKMHDIIHDFAQFLTGNECLIVGEADGGPNIAQNARHLNLLRYEDGNDISLSPKLHSIFCNRLTPPNLFSHLKRVKLLSVRDCNLEEIPKEIGNLIHLRYLDLSWNSYLKELPQTVCDLYNLQTLGIQYCISLSGLPGGIHKLKNLRHLLNGVTAYGFKYPEGFEKLTNLQTLETYFGNKLGYLKDLNQLKGALDILVDEVEVKKLDLKNKILLRALRLIVMNERSLEIIEDMQPPPNLESLYFEGFRLPKWTATLTNLRVLRFTNLRKEVADSSWTLPPLGKLPFLEELHLSGIETLGNDLLGINNRTTPFEVFPKLNKLRIESCQRWREWEDISEEEEENDIISIMPSLQQLFITDCPELKELPHRLMRKASSLEILSIRSCPHLQSRYNRETGEDWDKVSHIPYVEFSIF